VQCRGQADSHTHRRGAGAQRESPNLTSGGNALRCPLHARTFRIASASFAPLRFKAFCFSSSTISWDARISIAIYIFPRWSRGTQYFACRKGLYPHNIYDRGGMAEWLKAAVLKTVRGVTPSWVRILLPPPLKALSSQLSAISVPKPGFRSYFWRSAFCKPPVHSALKARNSKAQGASPGNIIG
jgi:hypothetical protein